MSAVAVPGQVLQEPDLAVKGAEGLLRWGCGSGGGSGGKAAPPPAGNGPGTYKGVGVRGPGRAEALTSCLASYGAIRLSHGGWAAAGLVVDRAADDTEGGPEGPGDPCGLEGEAN